MKKVWLTYSWKDNNDGAVEFIAQELEKKGIVVRLDRWNITAGQRLWEQIERFISNKDECDAWIFYMTPNSIGSEACKEEFAIALDRALSRGESFPIIGLSDNTDNNIIPTQIRTRLYVSLNDENWKERILSSVLETPLNLNKKNIEPYTVSAYEKIGSDGSEQILIEFRPRIGSWYPSFVAILTHEKDRVKPFDYLHFSPKGGNLGVSSLNYPSSGFSKDSKFWVSSCKNQTTSLISMYLSLQSKNLPSKLFFGSLDENDKSQIYEIDTSSLIIIKRK